MPEHEITELLLKAEEAIENEDPELALKLVEKYLQREPQNPDALAIKIDAFLEMDRLKEAEELLESSLKRHPDEVDLLIASADLIINQYSDDYDAIELAAERAEHAEKLALKMDEDLTGGHAAWILGRAMTLLGEPEEALNSLRRARLRIGDHPQLLLHLGAELFESHDVEEAQACLAVALEEDDQNADAHHMMGLIVEFLGNRDLANQHFERAAQLDPEEHSTWQLPEENLKEALEQVVAELPEDLKQRIRLFSPIIKDVPTPDDIQRSPGFSPLDVAILREKEGADFSEEALAARGELPLELVLYSVSITRYISEPDELPDLLDQIFRFEIGPRLGWEEE